MVQRISSIEARRCPWIKRRLARAFGNPRKASRLAAQIAWARPLIEKYSKENRFIKR
jgi:hypothetical protein